MNAHSILAPVPVKKLPFSPSAIFFTYRQFFSYSLQFRNHQRQNSANTRQKLATMSNFWHSRQMAWLRFLSPLRITTYPSLYSPLSQCQCLRIVIRFRHSRYVSPSLSLCKYSPPISKTMPTKLATSFASKTVPNNLISTQFSPWHFPQIMVLYTREWVIYHHYWFPCHRHGDK